MGVNSSCKLIIGYELEDIYELKETVEEWDEHDSKTGKKTGKRLRKVTKKYVNKYTKKSFDDPYDVDANNFHMTYHTGEYFLGVELGYIRDHDNRWIESFSFGDIEKARHRMIDELKDAGHFGDNDVIDIAPRIIMIFDMG